MTEDLLKEIRYTDEMPEKGRSMIIFGDPGAGKTSLIKTLNPEECLLICFDSGDIVLKDIHCPIFTIKPGEMKKFKDFVGYLLNNETPWKYIFMDNVSEAEKFFLIALTDTRCNGKEPRQKEWGDAAFWLRKYIRDLRSLTESGKHVVFIFWAMMAKLTDKDGEIESKVCPMCMAKTTMEYCGLVDFVAYMGHNAKGGRYLQFEPDKLIHAKKRDLPGAQLEKFMKPDLKEIYKLIEGGKK